MAAGVKKVVSDIKSLRIQGAQNIAEAALQAYATAKNKTQALKLLASARPTEAMLFNALDAVKKGADPLALVKKFQQDKNIIASTGAKLVGTNSVVFTHCHSSTVTDILKFAKKQKIRFEVRNTETRPMWQGRITARELAKAGVKVRHYVDSAVLSALRDASLFLIGADWISPRGVVNKIGTGAFTELAHKRKIPVYCCAHSWKFSAKKIAIEQRPAKEVWQNPPKNVTIENPAFELASAKHIKGIVSELGILSFKAFLRRVKNGKNKI